MFVQFKLKLMEMETHKQLVKNNNTQCLIGEFRKAGLFDVMLKEIVVSHSTTIESDEVQLKMDEMDGEKVKILENAAEVCSSDPDYEGTFDDILGETTTTKHKKYCSRKFVIDHGYLKVSGLNVNPEGIPTANINCDAFVSFEKTKHLNELRDELSQRRMKGDQVKCAVDLYDAEKMFEYSLLGDVLSMTEVSNAVKNRHRDAISRNKKRYEMSFISCLKLH